MDKRIARMILTMVLLTALSFMTFFLPVSAEEKSAATATLSDEQLVQYLVDHSPLKGSWETINGPYGNFSGTYDLVFNLDGKKLKAFVENTKYIKSPPPPFNTPWNGEVSFLKVRKGKVEFTAPDKADVTLKFADGKFTGTSWTGGQFRIQNQHTLIPASK